jgi:hypothetical protein
VVLMASTYGSKYLGDEKTSVSTRCYWRLTITSEDAFDKGDFLSQNLKILSGKIDHFKFHS